MGTGGGQPHPFEARGADPRTARRSTRQEDIDVASSFPDSTTAAAAISETLGANAAKLSRWLRSQKNSTVVTADFERGVGTVVDKVGHASEGHHVTVVIRRDPTSPFGFRVHAAYVTP